MKKFGWLILVLLFLAILLLFEYTNPSKIDIYANQNFGFVLDNAGIPKEYYIRNLTASISSLSPFAHGDAILIIGRLTNNSRKICSSIKWYKKSGKHSIEEKALAYETIASLGCNWNSKGYYRKAAKLWNAIGNKFRAEIDTALAKGNQPELKFEEHRIPETNLQIPANATKIIIGSSYILLDSKDLLLSQAERVSRDWLSAQLQAPFDSNLLTVFSEHFTYNQTELLPEIGWHEGARIKEIKQINITHRIASGTLIAKINDIWYAPNEQGIFMFEVPQDKVSYPTTRFLTENLAVVIDTHGINMLVEQAMRQNATAVIGCCDHPGKAAAAHYLASKGIEVICLTDRFVPELLGFENILGSPPTHIAEKTAVIGNQPVEINLAEKIIVMDSDKMYYDTPARYFRALEKQLKLHTAYVKTNSTKQNQVQQVTNTAELFNANTIAVRIFNSNDYGAVKKWLEKSKQHKAILFHSVSYPYGYKLFKEFPKQTTFDDPKPTVI